MRKEDGVKYFNDYNCAQAVIVSFAEALEINEEVALKIASSFGGGMGRGNTCGAITGALMVLGMLEGHYIKGDERAKAKCKELTITLQERFEEKHHSIMCTQLIGEEKSFERCAGYVSDVIQLVEELTQLKDNEVN